MIELILFFLMLIIPLFWLRVIKEQSWKQIRYDLLPAFKGWRKEIIGSLILLGLLLTTFVALVMGMYLVETILHNAFGINASINDLEKVGGTLQDEIGTDAVGFFASLFIILFIEEFFFRAFLVKRLGMVPSTLIFTVAHIGYGSIAELIGVFVLGMILAYWYKKNNSIVQNYLGHVLYDLVAVGLYLI